MHIFLCSTYSFKVLNSTVTHLLSIVVIFFTTTLWFVRIENSLKTQKYENHLNDILGCLFNQFLHELNDIELFLQYSRLKN